MTTCKQPSKKKQAYFRRLVAFQNSKPEGLAILDVLGWINSAQQCQSFMNGDKTASSPMQGKKKKSG